VRQVVKKFLCPSDAGQSVATNAPTGNGVPVIGPTNYAVCVGSGTTNGDEVLGNDF
jgi:hypothetical protein